MGTDGSQQQALFREIMAHFATGITIVTTRRGDLAHCMTASAIAPVSLDPVLVLVCVARTNVTHQIISETRAFAINILREGQEQLASLCASSDPGHHTLQGCAYHFGVTGVPILHETLGYLECRLVHGYPGGDHTIFVGEVVDMGLPSEGTPLLWYNRRYARLSALPEE